MRTLTGRLLTAIGGLLFFASDASACAVCFTGETDSLWAYYVTAILLTCLPLAMIGGASYWLIRRCRAVDAPAE